LSLANSIKLRILPARSPACCAPTNSQFFDLLRVSGTGDAPHVADRLDEALVRERLEQVVDGVQLERGQRGLVAGRGEDHGRLVCVAGQ
jgi:hypothetical protein